MCVVFQKEENEEKIWESGPSWSFFCTPNNSKHTPFTIIVTILPFWIESVCIN